MLTSFNEGILFFIILSTSIIMTIGMLFYRKGNADVVEETQFSDGVIFYKFSLNDCIFRRGTDNNLLVEPNRIALPS
jgi:hypothetical protein